MRRVGERRESAALTSLVEFLGPSVVPEHVKHAAYRGLTVLGVDHKSESGRTLGRLSIYSIDLLSDTQIAQRKDFMSISMRRTTSPSMPSGIVNSASRAS